MSLKLIALIIITLFFFSTSSILARAALLDNSIDAYSFTFFRLFFGSLTLVFILYFKEKLININFKKNWNGSIMLYLYAICFSFSYVNLDAGLGALILFAVVQLTTIFVGFYKGERVNLIKILGISLAFVGLVYLLLPNENISLSFFHVFLMIISGIAWGFYTIFGKTSKNATLSTSDNFFKATILITFSAIPFLSNLNISTYGVFLAFLSGGITSSLGYLLWYYLLPNLKIITAGVLQLLIPPLAIFLGVLLLNEELTTKLLVSTLIILLGIFIYLKSKQTT